METGPAAISVLRAAFYQQLTADASKYNDATFEIDGEPPERDNKGDKSSGAAKTTLCHSV